MATSSISNYNGTSAYNLKPNGIDTREMNGSYTPNQIPLSGLHLYYDPANPECYAGSGTTLTDLMGNTNSTIYGGMESSYVQNGWFTNDGVNDGIVSNTQVTLNSTGSLGWGVWFQYAGLTSTQLLIDDYWNNGGGDRYGLRVFFFGGNLRAQFTSPSNNSFNLLPYVSTNTWYFLYFHTRYNGNNTYVNQLWLGDINGVQQLVDTPAYSSSPPATSTQNETFALTDFKTSGASWGGKIGEAWRYYNHTLLTNAEVNSIFDNTKARYGY